MSLVKKVYPVEGMTCASCSSSVQTILESYDGVIAAGANFASNEARIEFDDQQISIEELKNALDEIGFQLITASETTAADAPTNEEHKSSKAKWQLITSAILSLPVMVIGMWLPSLPFGAEISALLTSIVLFVFGRRFFVRAWQLMKHRMANMDTLVALSTGTAYIYSLSAVIAPSFYLSKGVTPHIYFEAAAMVITFILFGKYLEERAKQQTSSELKSLVALQPNTVSLIKEGQSVQTSISEILPGDVLMIRPGDKIPLDGKIISGNSEINESLLSGEPLPIAKGLNDDVFAGTLNLDGTLNIEVTKPGNATLLARIILSVKEAQNSKAPIQKYADKIAGIFVPIVLGIAVLSFIIWFVSPHPESFTHAMISFVTVLVIACPCALGLATPTALMVGIGKAAKKGILIKNAESLEIFRKAQVIVLDKTGTLTEGNPTLRQENWFIEKTDLLTQVLATLESKSSHPLAKSLVEVYPLTGDLKLTHFQNQSGKGLTAKIDGETYWVGNKKAVEDNKGQVPESEEGTVVYFGRNHELIAAFNFEDKIRNSAASLISKLKSKGISPLLLSGDAMTETARVAKKLGIESYEGEVLPEQKADRIRALQKQGKTVAMAGDGINDSVALAAADVSIAMGKGADVAIDVADITLLNSEIEKLLPAYALSKATVKTIRQNLFWAFIYNLIGIPIAAGILYPFTGFLLNPMIAGAAMALSSVSVVTNSLRLKQLNLSYEI